MKYIKVIFFGVLLLAGCDAQDIKSSNKDRDQGEKKLVPVHFVKVAHTEDSMFTLAKDKLTETFNLKEDSNSTFKLHIMSASTERINEWGYDPNAIGNYVILIAGNKTSNFSSSSKVALQIFDYSAAAPGNTPLSRLKIGSSSGSLDKQAILNNLNKSLKETGEKSKTIEYKNI
jgi:hypothetical protein